MSKFFKSLLLLLSAGLFTATGWAVTYTATNVSIATGTDGGSYDWAQFKFVDVQNAITNEVGESVKAEAVSEYLDVTSVAILRRYDKGDWPNTITVNLMAANGSVLENGTSRTLTTDDVTTSSGQTVKWMVFTFATPVRINKNMIYRIKTSSDGQQYYMSKVSGKTGKNNTSILASAGQDDFSPFVRIVATSVDLSEFSRTIASGENNWSESDVWQSGGMNFASPTEGTIAKLSVTGEATLKMNASASVASMNISGNGSLTIAKTDSNKLTATTTTINADTTVNAGAASLGTVTIAADKTLTVKEGVALASLSGSGTLNLDVGESTTLENCALDFFNGVTKVSSGTLKYTASANRPRGEIIVSGASAALQIATNTDILGHSGVFPGITIENGGRFEAFRRDTFSRVLTLNSGHLVFSADDQGSSRSFDLYNNSKIVSSGTSKIGGKNATNDAESNDLIVASGIIAIRRSDLEIEVTDGTLSVYSAIGTADNSGGSVYKKGAGTLAIYRAATSALPVVVEAGELRLVRKGSLTTGAMTVNANATLAYVGTQSPTNTLTNNGMIAADGEGTEVNLTGATLSGSGRYVARNGAILKLTLDQVRVLGNTVAADGGKVYVVLNASQQGSEQTVTTVSTSNNGVYQFVDANDNPLSGPNMDYVLPNVCTYDVAEDTWDIAPRDFDNVVIALGDVASEVNLSTVLDNVTALSKLTITGTNGGTITNVADVAICTAIVLTTATTMPVELAARAYTIESTATLSIVGTAEETTVAGVISGVGGQVKIAEGKVKFTAANTYTGGTEIAAGATIEVATIGKLPTSGAIVVDGRLRVNSGNSGTDDSAQVWGTAEFPRLTGSGVLEFVGTNFYVLPDGFTTPLAIENNHTGGIVVSNMNGITIGTLSGEGKFRSDWGTDNTTSEPRVITVKQSAASTFSGTISPHRTSGSRRIKFLVTKAEGVAENVDTTLTLKGNAAANNGAILAVAEGAMVKVAGEGSWAQSVVGAGTIIFEGKLPMPTGSGYTNATSWSGTVKLQNYTGSSNQGAAELNLDAYGNANSVVELANVVGWVGNGTVVPKLCLSENGLTFNNGSTSNMATITVNALSGFGAIKGAVGKNWKYHVVVEDSTDFKGAIDLSATTSQNVSVVFGEGNATNGKIIIAQGTTIPAGKTWKAKSGVEVSSTGTLSGTGEIASALTLAADATIDATAGAVTCSGEVTLPETGTVTVQAKAYGAAVLKKSELDVTKFALPPEPGASKWKTTGLFTEKDGALLLVAKPTFTPPDGTPAMSDETARVIAELAAESGSYGVTSVAVAAGRNPAAVEVFNNVMTVNSDTATISYDFGVADMTIKSLQLLPGDNATTMYVLLAAKVQNSANSNTASFAEGTKLTVLNGSDEITPTKVSAAEAGAVAETGVQWLAVPLARLFPENNSLGTRPLKVKASKASN